MADGAGDRTIRYSAFISYSHADEAAARKLQSRLETYRLPRGLGRHENVRSGDPRRLKPVFRDRDELVAAPDLTEAVKHALEISSALIVVCSSAAATSEWVGREIALFRLTGRGGRILAALKSGTPDESFHSELLADAASGHSPLAADFRTNGDGFRLALLKLVAVLAGVGLDELIRRDARRRSRWLFLVAASVLFATLMAAVLVWTTLQARASEEYERQRSLSSVDYALNELRDRAKGVGSLGMRDAANDVASHYLDTTTKLSEDELISLAKLFVARGEDNEARGEYTTAQRQFEDALAITSKLVNAQPRDTKRIFSHAQSLYWVGFISWRLGDSSRAEAAFRDYAAAAARLTRLEPGRPDWLMERAYAADNLGMLALRRAKDTVRAEIYFEDELAYYRLIQQLRPADVAVLRAIADTQGWLGDIQRLRGDFTGAAATRGVQRALIEKMLERDPRNAELQSALTANKLAIARIAADTGALTDAILMFDAGHADALKLAQADPDNISLSRKVRIFELFKAKAWLSMRPDARPAAPAIATTIGDCARDRTVPRNDELADFCVLLRARFEKEMNRNRVTQPMSILRSQARSGDVLSERWGIDFREEARFISDEQQGKRQ